MAVDKNQLKQMLRPLLKECLKELLMEEKGVLSHIISESLEAIKPMLVLAEGNKNNVVSMSSRQKKDPLGGYFQKLQEERIAAGPPPAPAILKKPGLGRFFQGTQPIEADPLEAIQQGYQSAPAPVALPRMSIPPTDLFQGMSETVVEDTNDYSFGNVSLPGVMAGEDLPEVDLSSVTAALKRQ
jgi:hypothetical protein